MTVPFRIALAIAVFSTLGGVAFAQSTQRNFASEETNRKLVVEFYDRFFNKHETAEAAQVVADDYKQHNPNVPDGKQVFVSFFTKMFKDNPERRSRIVRSATDGDLVYLHVHSQLNANDLGSAIVDIFRVKDGKIVEHWDVVQKVPEKAANQNTMF
ncbi:MULTISPECIES: ester cyclase [unclassified Beijerinckia]|uniref:nuclear transport factor 2 family protein n=1 Tax=unclassified Beijerinckia TaxID=2638183 RepID=UPI00089933E8|nr:MULTISPECIES: ester cyclase [unclassified Beijerinckia]MDH7794825.1 putative SnoaL-like aldol condensation-catalyzing enzyme [Beijerinckia sp. GAS462]SEB76663.1 Predicted SnoaL-like aldol condensation-catalyzing enzyme [Beijerinckia sp. 28-YEA-48]